MRRILVISAVSEQAASNAMFLEYWKEAWSKTEKPATHLPVTTKGMEHLGSRSDDLKNAVPAEREERVERLRFEYEDVEAGRTGRKPVWSRAFRATASS